jgi:hypothetical protein
LLAATRRSLTSTWKVEEHFVRTTAAGRSIEATQRRVRRPPDSLLLGGGTVSATRNGRALACATGPGGELHCSDAGPAPDVEVQADQAVATLRQQVEGPNALYSVRQDRDCFVLRLLVPGYVAPPYGQTATLCYDPATGAPVRTEIHRAEGTDLTVATSVSAAVSDADLAPVS